MGMKLFGSEEREGRRWSVLVVPVILILLFLLAFAIRSVFYWPPAVAPVDTYGDEGYLLSGNDPNYIKRTADYVQETHTHLVFDDMLNYPNGGPNPNPPLYAWSVALMGYLISPFFGGDVHTATWYMMEFAAAFWAALTIFPVYVFTRDMFGKKPGILAAFFIAVMAGNVERTPVGFSDHDAFVVFFVVLAFLFLMRALRMLNNRSYVKDWFNARDIAVGTRDLLRENRKAFMYATLSALSISAVALAWKGVVYIFAIILVYFVFHLAIKKLKKEEGLGIALIILFTVGLSLLIAFPYYNIKYFTVWFESPFFVFVAMGLLALLLVPTRDLPWLLVVPMILVLLLGGLFVLQLLFPSIVDTIISLQGYFVRTKLYETIAEAQAPDFSRMVFSYGVVTFYLTIAGAALAAYRLPKERWRNDYIVTVIWAIVGIYMALTAVRFMYNATPIFSIFAGWMTYEIIKWSGFDKMLKTYRGLKSEPLYAVRKSVKPRHIIMSLFLVFLIIWPNFWYGLDAGVPYEEKSNLDNKMYDAFPEFMRPTEEQYSQASTWWFGSFGTSYPSAYWVDGMFWLAEQDSDKLPTERPAFISWWDYGHWAVHMGEHPAAADNFQNGFQWAGNYISAQNESVAVSLVASKIIEGTMFKNEKSLDLLERYVGEENRKAFVDYYWNPENYKSEVLGNPHIYGPHDKDRMDRANIKYLMMSRMLATNLELEELVNLVNDLEVATGKSMRYFAVDTRLLPVGPQNTGIYYAPIKLSDQNIDDFLVVYAVGNDGSRTNVNNEKAMREKYEDQEFKVEKYEIEYTEMFYNSMFYRAYIGWQPLDAEINEPGIPIISRATDVGRDSLTISSMPPIQGWGMQHHRLEYKTTYWNPNRTDLSAHSGEWDVIQPDDAAKYKNWSESEDSGVVDRSGTLDTVYRPLYGGVFFLKYYDGAFINGTITLEDGSPLPGARITVYDDLDTGNPGWPGAPHGFTYTDEDGRYSIVAPYGNVTVRVSSGGQSESGDERTNQLLMQMEKRLLNETVIGISDNQAMRVMEDTDGDGIWDYNIRHDVTVNLSTVEGVAYWDVNDDDSFNPDVDEPLAGHVSLTNSSYGRNLTAELAQNGSFAFTGVIADDYDLNYIPAEGQDYRVMGLAVSAKQERKQDIAITPAAINGTVVDRSNATIEDAGFVLKNRTTDISYDFRTDVNGTYNLTRLLPGNYTIGVDDVRFNALDILVDMKGGDGLTQNITVTRTVSLSGTALLPGGTPVSYATVVFRNLDDDSQSVNIKVKKNGGIEGNIPPGNYSINARVIRDGATYVFMRTMDLGGNVSLRMDFLQAMRMNGTVFEDLNGNGAYDRPEPDNGGIIPTDPTSDPGGTTPGGTAAINEGRGNTVVDIDGADGNISLTTNDAGYYEVYLPPGEYVVYAHSATSETNLTTIQTVKLDKDRKVDVQVQKGTMLEGSVFHDIDLGGVLDEGEALPGAPIVLEDGQQELTRYSNTTGAFHLLLPNNVYNLSIQYEGYEPYEQEMTIAGGNLYKNLILSPKNITVRGSVGHDADADGRVETDEYLPNVTVKIVARDASWDRVEVVTDANGTFEASVFPQAYRVEVNQTGTYEDSTVRYAYEADLNLSIGSEDQELLLGLEVRYKVHGDIFYDLNDNGVLNSGERRSPIVVFYDALGARNTATTTTDGYSIFLPEGVYYYYTHDAEPDAPTSHTAAMGRLMVYSEMEEDIPLQVATRLNGMVYYDEDGDLEMDDGEQERDVVSSFSVFEGETKVAMTIVKSSDRGEYSVYVPWGFNYTVNIDLEEERTLYNNDYTVRYTYLGIIQAIEGEDSLQSDLLVDKFYLVHGDVIYQGPEGDEPLEGALVRLGEFSTRSDEEGLYEFFVRPGEYDPEVVLAGFVLPESVFGNRTIEYDRTEQKFILDPANVTVEGHVFFDLDGDGAMDPREEGLAAYVEFIAADDRAINGSTNADPAGTFVIDLEPGRYFVWIHSDAGVQQYAYFKVFGLRASGEVLVQEFELERAVTLQGAVFLTNTDGVKVTPAGANITIYDNVTGVQRQVTVTGRQYALPLPPGEYNLTSQFKSKEYSQEMSYTLDVALNLTDRTKMDLVFEKERLWYVSFEWDEAQRAKLHQNETTNYTITVTNVGNEAHTFEIEAAPPTGWVTEISLAEVSLGIGDSRTFRVQINASKDAAAGENPITIKARSTVNDDFVNTSKVYVDIYQRYNISLTASTQDPTFSDDIYTYFFSLKNDGNGEDKVKVELVAPFPKWNITFPESEFEMGSGQMRDVTVNLQPEDPANMTGRPMTLHIRATSEKGLTAEYRLLVSFPDLQGSIDVSGPGVKVKKGGDTGGIPGFEAVALVMAVAVAAAYMGRRRRGEGGDVA